MPKQQKNKKEPTALKKREEDLKKARNLGQLTTREVKIKLAKTKIRINEANADKAVNKKIVKELSKRKHGDLTPSDFSVIESGVKNNYQVAYKEYVKLKATYSEMKYLLKINKISKTDLESTKTDLLKAKEMYKKEAKIISSEVRQIQKLNNRSKGFVKIKSKDDVAIEVNNANKIYASKNMIFNALSDVNITLKKGSFNVILGPSGSGKTTLLNMVSGLDRATYGDIVVNGTNLSALTTGQLTQFRRNNVGFIFQSYNLLPSLNVSDNIEVGRTLQTNANKRKDIKSLLTTMDMSQSRKKKTYELSGGQQQRVSIARAIAKSPSILIGDEPTGALDQTTSKAVFGLFQDINKSQKTTIIIVTHNPNVAQLADKVIYVKNGMVDKVIENKNPKLAKNLKEI